MDIDRQSGLGGNAPCCFQDLLLRGVESLGRAQFTDHSRSHVGAGDAFGHLAVNQLLDFSDGLASEPRRMGIGDVEPSAGDDVKIEFRSHAPE